MRAPGAIARGDDALGYLFRRACQIHSARSVACLQAVGLRPVQFLVLEVIMLAPGRDATQIAAWTMLDPATLSVQIKRLTDLGWLERRPNPNDRRAKLLHATRAGAAVAKRGQRSMRAARRELEPRLRAAEWTALIPLLQRVLRLNLEAPAAGAPPFPHFSDVRFLLRSAQNLHAALHAERLAPFGLTLAQFVALDAVARTPGADATQIGERAALDPATLSVLLSNLAADGLLKRQPNPLDARGKLLSLSRKGAALLRRAEPAARDAGDALTARLPARDWRIVTAALAHYCDVVEPPNPRRALDRAKNQ